MQPRGVSRPPSCCRVGVLAYCGRPLPRAWSAGVDGNSDSQDCAFDDRVCQ